MAKRKRRKTKASGKTAGYKAFRISIRVTREMQTAIETAQKSSGRTITGEIEHQLERALFEWGVGPTFAIMAAIGKAVDNLAKMQIDVDGGWTPDAGARWWRDPYLFDQARQAVIAALELFKPQGAPPDDPLDLLDLGGPRQGQFAIECILRDVQLVDPAMPPANQSPRTHAYWRWLCWLREDIGYLIDNPVIHGRSARQVQYLRNRSADFRDELIALTREGARKPEDMPLDTYRAMSRADIEALNLAPEKRKRLAELRRQLALFRKESE